jgi:hypothetical protein
MHVEHDLRLLPDRHVGEVGLLEVGLQPRPAVGDQREQRRLRLDLLAELQLEIDDDAGARRLDLGIGKIERRAVAQRQLLAHGGELIGRPVGLAAERRLHARDALVQHREPVLAFLLLAVGLLDPRRRADAAAGQFALALGLHLRYDSLFSASLASARISRRLALSCSTAARAESISASALASAS